MKPRHRRAAIVVGMLAALGLAAGLVLDAFRSNLVFFYTPSQVAAREAPHGRSFRIGGVSNAIIGQCSGYGERRPTGNRDDCAAICLHC